MSHQSTTPTPDIGSIIDRARPDNETVLSVAEREELLTEIERNLYDGASIDEVYQAAIQAVTARVEREPTVTARVEREPTVTARVEREPKFKQIAAVVFCQRYYREILGEGLTGFDLDRTYRDTFVTNL